LGFFLWLAALAVLGVIMAYPYCVAGDYVVMPVLGVVFWKAWSQEA